MPLPARPDRGFNDCPASSRGSAPRVLAAGLSLPFPCCPTIAPNEAPARCGDDPRASPVRCGAQPRDSHNPLQSPGTAAPRDTTHSAASTESWEQHLGLPRGVPAGSVPSRSWPWGHQHPRLHALAFCSSQRGCERPAQGYWWHQCGVPRAGWRARIRLSPPQAQVLQQSCCSDLCTWEEGARSSPTKSSEGNAKSRTQSSARGSNGPGSELGVSQQQPPWPPPGLPPPRSAQHPRGHIWILRPALGPQGQAAGWGAPSALPNFHTKSCHPRQQSKLKGKLWSRSSKPSSHHPGNAAPAPAGGVNATATPCTPGTRRLVPAPAAVH